MIIGVPIHYYADGANPSHMAYLDTITDSFLSFNGCEVFDSLDDLKMWCDDEKMVERLAGVSPKWFKGDEK